MKQALLIFFLLISLGIAGQQTGYINLREKKVLVEKPEITIDTFSIQPFYFEILDAGNQLIPPESYHIDFVKAKLFLKDFETYKDKELLIKYLVYPEYLRKTYQIYDVRLLEQDSLQSISLLPPEQFMPKPLEGLKTQGYIFRGFNAGNNQSLVMQSGLDLKIEGKISSKLKVKAVLSDDNLPQAYAGISQSYKEFDRIYMQLIAPNWQATGGDLFLKENKNYFLKFIRKTQGLSLQMRRDSSQVQLTGGYVEGQFGINRFQGQEGNQGPYVLKGNQGELYIFIIPDSEKVFVNGKRLQRGPAKDYTIQYETAEIRFNPTFPITQNMRIVVEFNYSNQHYMRYLNHNTYQLKRAKTTFSVYSFIESDVKTKTLLYDLDKKQVEVLRNAGDNLQALWVSSARKTTFNEDKILYKKVHNGNVSYFEYTQQNIPDLYEVRFSYIGKHKGDYQIKQVVANGKIFEYAGENQGDYAPVVRLTPPQQKAYLGMGYVFHPGEKTNLAFQGLINYADKNLFSHLDDQNNVGGAMHWDLQQTLWQKDSTQLQGHLLYDYVSSNFMALDPYRSVEFSRQWQIYSIFGKQHLLDLGLDYHTGKQWVNAGGRYFSMRDSVTAYQLYGQSNLQHQKWQSQTDLQYTGRNRQIKLSALLLDQTLSYDLSGYQIQAAVHYENREQKQLGVLDSLNYQYRWGELRWVKKDSSRLGYQIFYRKEQNDSIFKNRWQRTNDIDNIGFKIRQKGKNHQIEWFMQYRYSRYLRADSVKKYLNLVFDWQQKYAHAFLTTQLHIASFNGNTLRDEIMFVPTPPGQGTHMWIDYNQNGIKEINEFEVAVYSDQADYIRVILPAKNYVPTLNNTYRFQLTINPEVWQKRNFWRNFYGIFRVETSHQSIQKGQDFPLVWQPQEVLSQNRLWQQDWFYNRAKKKYHLHFSYQFIDQMQWLVIGQQAQQLERYQLQTKHAFNTNWIWQQKFSTGYASHQSENYTQKNYHIDQDEIEEGFSFETRNKKRFYTYFNYKHKKNISGDEVLSAYKTGINYSAQKAVKNSVHLDLQLIQNNLEGNPQSPVAFQMLEALQVGKNLVFTALYRQKINSYLDLYVNYNFRLSETNPAVHTGGIQLKMIF